MLSTLFTVLQIVIGLFLIFIIMLQRGKGGGLVGALGGMGGASAFGPKADIHVLKLTIGLAVAWVVVACSGIYLNRTYTSGYGEDNPTRTIVKDAATKDGDNVLNDEDAPKIDADEKKSEGKAAVKKATTKGPVIPPAKAETQVKTGGEALKGDVKADPVKSDAAPDKEPATDAAPAKAATEAEKPVEEKK
jgi:preprotein translocase subunit SecG